MTTNEKIKRAEFSEIFKIGKKSENGKVYVTEDSFYCNDGFGKKVLHLNKLAWESPSVYTSPDGNEHRGFISGDKFYDEIIAEFKSFKDRWREENIVRKIIPNSQYDAIVFWYREVKMVSWFFEKSYEYSI